MRSVDKSVESYDSIFSRELFGMGKKKPSNQEPTITIEEVRKLPKYDKTLFEKCAKQFINAWNWKAYKLPTSLGKDDDGNENDDKNRGFEAKITPLKNKIGYEELNYCENVRNGKLMIEGEGIYVFAYGQPTDFPLYRKVLDDISTRWEKRLEEKLHVVKDTLIKIYDGIEIYAYVDTGDGDEGCVYPNYQITIPINSLK